MPIEAITNGESGSSVRAKLNSVISATNSAPTEVRPIAYGGTGAETAAAARVNLGTETVVPGVAQVITLTIESTPSSEWAGLYIDIYDGAGVCRFWVMQSGSGDAPSTPSGGRLQLVNVTGFDIIDAETAFLTAFSSQSSAFSATGSGTGLITVTNVFAAAAPAPAHSSPSLPLALNVSTLGVDSYRQLPAVDGSQLYNVTATILPNPTTSEKGGVIASEGSTGQFAKGLDTAGNLIYSGLGTTAIANGGTGQTTAVAAFDALAPTTTKGDLIVHNGTDNVRLAVGPTNGHVLTVDSTQATGIRWIAPSGGSGGTKTIAQFTARDNQPPATNFATLDSRNSIAILDFDTATEESAIFVGVIPEGAVLTSGLTVLITWTAATATSGACRWGAQWMRLNTDIDSDSFDTATEVTTTTNATSGIPSVTSITCTTIDGVTVGDAFRLWIYRDTGDAADTMAGDAELIAVEVRTAN